MIVVRFLADQDTEYCPGPSYAPILFWGKAPVNFSRDGDLYFNPIAWILYIGKNGDWDGGGYINQGIYDELQLYAQAVTYSLDYEYVVDGRSPISRTA